MQAPVNLQSNPILKLVQPAKVASVDLPSNTTPKPPNAPSAVSKLTQAKVAKVVAQAPLAPLAPLAPQAQVQVPKKN